MVLLIVLQYLKVKIWVQEFVTDVDPQSMTSANAKQKQIQRLVCLRNLWGFEMLWSCGFF